MPVPDGHAGHDTHFVKCVTLAGRHDPAGGGIGTALPAAVGCGSQVARLANRWTRGPPLPASTVPSAGTAARLSRRRTSSPWTAGTSTLPGSGRRAEGKGQRPCFTGLTVGPGLSELDIGGFDGMMRRAGVVACFARLERPDRRCAFWLGVLMTVMWRV